MQRSPLLPQRTFEEIIQTSVATVRSHFARESLAAFEEQLNRVPKKLKELTAEPYFFVFQQLVRKEELVLFTLTNLQVMLDENYLTGSLFGLLANLLLPLVPSYAYQVMQLLESIKAPTLHIFKLFFEIHSTVALPEDRLKAFRSLGYRWLIRIFHFIDLPLNGFLKGLRASVNQDQLPQLMSVEEKEVKLRAYVSKIVSNLVSKVECSESQGGRYGLCFMCHKSANYYCKDTKVPVCSVLCKKEHLLLLEENQAVTGEDQRELQLDIEEFLHTQLTNKRSPALCADFLTTIYLFSQYRPRVQMVHRKVFAVPIVYERTWLLYAAYYEKQGLMFQQIFLGAMESVCDYQQQIATEYFLAMCKSDRLLEVYYCYDCKGHIRLVAQLLRRIEAPKRHLLISGILDTLLKHWRQTAFNYENRSRGLIRSFNHQKQLPMHLFELVFGEQRKQQIVQFLLRNEFQINRGKLSELVSKNEGICRILLHQIVNRLQGAAVDEILREIFYFVNVKVSDKIYRLLELLCEECLPLQLFNEDNFFQYTYFVIMIVTELHNPALVVRPSFESIKDRVKEFHPELVQKHPHLLRDMYERVSCLPFSQEVRGLLDYYPNTLKTSLPVDFLPEIILADNWEFVYETFLTEPADVGLVARCCRILSQHPAICQPFLQLLIDQLNRTDKDSQYGNQRILLVSVIREMIKRQPNAVGCSWSIVFNEVQIGKEMGKPNEEDKFDLLELVEITLMLTNDNFIIFVREFCSTFDCIKQDKAYIQLLNNNCSRLPSISHLFIATVSSCGNTYVQILFLFTLQNLFAGLQGQALWGIFLSLLKSVSVTPITSNLLVQIFVAQRTITTEIDRQIWQEIAEKCLIIASQSPHVKAEEIVRGMPLDSDEFAVRLALNCRTKAQVDSMTFRNLSILESHLPRMHEQVLRKFITFQDSDLVIRNFEIFSKFHEACLLTAKHVAPTGNRVYNPKRQLLLQKYQNILDMHWCSCEREYLCNDQFTILLCQAALYSQPINTVILNQYLQVLAELQQNSFWQLNVLKLKHIGILAQQINCTYLTLEQHLYCEQKTLLFNFLRQLSTVCSNFNSNHILRTRLEEQFSSEEKAKNKTNVFRRISLLKPEMQLLRLSIYLLTSVVHRQQSLPNSPPSPLEFLQQTLLDKMQLLSRQLCDSSIAPAQAVFAKEVSQSLSQFHVQYILLLKDSYSKLSASSKARARKLLGLLLLRGIYSQQTGDFIPWSKTEHFQTVLKLFSDLELGEAQEQ